MGRKRLLAGRGGQTDSRGMLMVGVEGIVVSTDDPERMHRVKVLIPSIDENLTHDEWVTALVPWVGAAGYGPVHPPEVGSEVVLFGRLGQTHGLFYLSRFNEDFPSPAEFAGGARGCKCDTVYRLLCDLLIEVRSQTEVLVAAGQQVNADAPDVRLRAGGAVGVHAQGAKVGFLGASPKARQQVPGPATDLGSCISLANALRTALINFGLAQ